MVRASCLFPIGWVVALLAICANSLGQTTVLSGFYINISNKKKCSNLITAFVGRDDYCVSENPIIGVSEFESISRIKIDPITGEQSIVLKLSPVGNRAWEGVLKNLPDALLVLVVEGYVVGTFKNEGYRKSNVIPIYAPRESSQLQWIYDHLKSVMVVE